VPGITLADIRKTVEHALDTRLKPMNRMLVESTDHKPTVSDIAGGIGYILGLAGVGMYFHYRSRIKELEKE
jgi:nickel transport protein